MKVMERWIAKVEDGMAETYLQRHKDWEPIDERLGFAGGKRIYRCLAGPDDGNTFVWEREWESFAAMESAYERGSQDPEARALSSKPDGAISNRIEFYIVTG
jgi:hypothetical protein